MQIRYVWPSKYIQKSSSHVPLHTVSFPRLTLSLYELGLSVILHRRQLPQGYGGNCPRRETPHWVPPCEELDPTMLYSIKLVFVQKITFICRKNQQKLPPPELLF